MYTATVLLNITTFNPIGSGNVAATIGAPVNTSPAAPGSANVFSGTNGQSITITRPAKYTGAVQLTFQLYSQDYLLAGIAVNAKTPTGKNQQSSAGRTQFRTVSLNRDTSGSQMVVTDALLDNANYDYLILVQSVATGQIGAIDPDIDNEGGE